MKTSRATMKILVSFLTLLTAATIAFAQQSPTTAADQLTTPDPIEQLRLTPDQRQAIRRIVAENKNERQMNNRRVREANMALDQALDIEPPDRKRTRLNSSHIPLRRMR